MRFSFPDLGFHSRYMEQLDQVQSKLGLCMVWPIDN